MASTASKITRAAITDISDMLAPSPRGQRMPMAGFDTEFVDIVDYIIRITDRIWHERRIDLCHKYYTDDCVINTMTGTITGATTIERNTQETLAAFPDRTLDGDNVIWSGNERSGYYSSHLITSRMTNKGASEYGAATGKRVRIRTIADCVCLENKIIHEWLMRDNASLVQQLGLSATSVAHQQAQRDIKDGQNILTHVHPWREAITPLPVTARTLPEGEKHPLDFARVVLGAIWAGQDFDLLPHAYDFRVTARMTAGRDLYGTLEYCEYLQNIHACLEDVAISIDHIADIPYLGDARDVALRWSLRGVHSGDGMWGNASGAPIYILGATHWRLINGRIREETTVFDELALYRQIAAHRIMQHV